MEKRDYKFKDFDRMTKKDYAKIGFKSGLEVHQQLLTAKKLFCHCPAGQYSPEYDAEILRHMRPTLSEMGEYDGTALMEFKTKKNITYRIHHDTVCTYEMDDTPPFMINPEALQKAIAIGLLFKGIMVDELHIARKQYLDGSIPTGFQRTSIYCLNAKFPFGKKQIDILQISIEEDSCREIEDSAHERTWQTDRLGMPLIEIVTAPQMKTPQELAEVCECIRRGTRSTGLVRTGVGSSREDVNVSVRGGTRIEIKGVSSIKTIPRLAYNEAMRQWNLLRLKDELHKRDISTKTFSWEEKDLTKLLSGCSFQPLKKAISNKGKASCVVLKGFAGLLKWKTQTGTEFAKEIEDRIRVIACLDKLPNIIHSDNIKGNLSAPEWRHIKQAVGAGNKDACVITWGPKEDVETAVSEIAIRAREACMGIPSETRQSLKDGTNGFERILPGADRMYPDTDLPPHRITVKELKEAKRLANFDYWKREQKYRKLNIPEDVIIPLCLSPLAGLFEELIFKRKLPAMLCSVALIQFPKRLKKSGLETSALNEGTLNRIFTLFEKGKLPKDGILQAMYVICKKNAYQETELPTYCSEKTINNTIGKTEKALDNMTLFNPDKRNDLLSGMVMKKLRGRLNGAELNKFIEKK